MRGYDHRSYGDGFADVYDEWYADVTDVDATVMRMVELAGPGGRVLELGVGTGRLAVPIAHAGRFDPLAAEVIEHGGTASVMVLSPRDDAQRAEITALFDRGPAYAEWWGVVRQLKADLRGMSEGEARRKLRAISDDLEAIRRIDYYPGSAGTQADEELVGLRAAVDAQFSPGEPTQTSAGAIRLLDIKKHQGKRWATRARPWVDRLACAWLIKRFIDPRATFVWLDNPAKAPRGALGFDYDGARFTHVGGLVTFEVIAASFGLQGDTKLQRIAQAVHFLDVGGIPVPEAAGLEAILAGLRAVHDDDDRLTKAASAVFDALYAAPEVRP